MCSENGKRPLLANQLAGSRSDLPESLTYILYSPSHPAKGNQAVLPTRGRRPPPVMGGGRGGGLVKGLLHGVLGTLIVTGGTQKLYI